MIPLKWVSFEQKIISSSIIRKRKADKQNCVSDAAILLAELYSLKINCKLRKPRITSANKYKYVFPDLSQASRTWYNLLNILISIIKLSSEKR